jgi:hypothetical protein
MLRRRLESKLTAAIRVAIEPAAGATVMQGLLQSVEYKARARGARDPPADDPAREHLDDEGDTDEARLRRDIGEVRHPRHVRRRRQKVEIDPIE